MTAEQSVLTEDTTDREIVINRIFDAPRELVFDLWTSPEHIGAWWGPRGFTTTTHAMEVRPGGVWRFVMHGPDGVDYDNEIVYSEVVRPERLAYAHGSGPGVENDPHAFDVVVTFEDLEGRTSLTMRSVFGSAAQRRMVVEQFGAIEGGNQTLDRLGEYVATL